MSSILNDTGHTVEIFVRVAARAVESFAKTVVGSIEAAEYEIRSLIVGPGENIRVDAGTIVAHPELPRGVHIDKAAFVNADAHAITYPEQAKLDASKVTPEPVAPVEAVVSVDEGKAVAASTVTGAPVETAPGKLEPVVDDAQAADPEKVAANIAADPALQEHQPVTTGEAKEADEVVKKEEPTQPVTPPPTAPVVDPNANPQPATPPETKEGGEVSKEGNPTPPVDPNANSQPASEATPPATPPAAPETPKDPAAPAAEAPKGPATSESTPEDPALKTADANKQ